MSDIIRRQDAIDIILSDKITGTSLDVMNALGDGRLALTLNDACDRHIRYIEKLPSAEPERKKGKWIDKSGGIEGSWNYCSVCGEQAIDLYDFCPNCEAYMEETNGKNV